jgi:hypothetical protein
MVYTAIEVVAHGFRAATGTLLAEILGVRPALIEAQLTHPMKEPLVNSQQGKAFDRAKWLRHRRRHAATLGANASMVTTALRVNMALKSSWRPGPSANRSKPIRLIRARRLELADVWRSTPERTAKVSR